MLCSYCDSVIDYIKNSFKFSFLISEGLSWQYSSQSRISTKKYFLSMHK